MRALLPIVLLAGCGDDALLDAGKTCATSDECAAGLLCDFGKTPHVCAPSESVSRDMAVTPADAKAPDLGGDLGDTPDLRNPALDLSGSQPDLTATD